MKDSEDIFATIATIVIILAFGMALSWFSCDARWEGSKMAHSWRPIAGCRVQLQDGQWIPEDRYRGIEE